MSSSSTSPPPLDPTAPDPEAPPVDGRQPNLFDPDDASLDHPVPFVLTGKGRRLVDPAVPRLRVVDASTASPDEQETPLEEQLGGTDGPVHARVRALQRAGSSTDEIAEQLDLDPLAVRVWTAPAPVTGARVPGNESSPRVLGRRHGEHQAAVVGRPRDGNGWSGAAGTARDERGLALLAAIGDLEPGGVVATTHRIAVARELVAWLRARHGVAAGAVRVVLRVADHATADLVGHAWADQLGIGRDRVLTVPWRAAPTPQSVQAVLRITGRELSAALGEQLAAWPASPTADR